MKTLREIAKENAAKIIDENLDRYNELSHLSHNHIWLEAMPDGTVHETEEASMQTYHYVKYSEQPVADILTIASCQYCDCDACASYKQAFDDDVSSEDFSEKWGYDRTDVDPDFATHLRDYEMYNYDFEQDALDAIDDIDYGYFDDEQ